MVDVVVEANVAVVVAGCDGTALGLGAGTGSSLVVTVGSVDESGPLVVESFSKSAVLDLISLPMLAPFVSLPSPFGSPADSIIIAEEGDAPGCAWLEEEAVAPEV